MEKPLLVEAVCRLVCQSVYSGALVFLLVAFLENSFHKTGCGFNTFLNTFSYFLNSYLLEVARFQLVVLLHLFAGKLVFAGSLVFGSEILVLRVQTVPVL